MRIAVDARALLDGQPSGVQVYTTRIIQSMLTVAPHHEYHLFYNSARAPQMPVFSGNNIQWHPFRYPNKVFNASQWLFQEPRWDRLIKADCFFVPSLRLVPLHQTKPLVTVVHDLSFERFPEFFSWRMRAWHHMMRPRFLMQRSHHLVTISQSTATDVTTLYGISPEKISVIYPGVSSVPIPSEADQERIRKKYALPPSYVLYFGTLEPRKNVVGIIQAFSAIAKDIPHTLVLAGRRGWLPYALDQALHDSQVHHRIHLPGIIAEEDKPAVYRMADAFVYPSFYEGFGFPPLEALIMGTPVITSYNSSLPEVVGPWATLINPADISELALVMREVVTHPSRVPDTVRTAIQAKYSWEQAARDTVNTIQKVCE